MDERASAPEGDRTVGGAAGNGPVGGDEVARPRFWGPASWWRLGIAAFAVLLLAMLLLGR